MPAVLYTAAALKDLQRRYTALRVFIIGVSINADESLLDVAAPLNPTHEPCVPFGIRTVPTPKHSQPARWIRVCGTWFLCAVAVKDALERLTTVTALGPGEEPADLQDLTVETRLERHMTHAVTETIRDEEALLIHGNPTAPEPNGILSHAPLKPAYNEGVKVTLHGEEGPVPDSWRSHAVCGCGDSVCEHDHCATCDPQGLACGDCAPTRGDR